jgi:hypothetical protein
VRSHWAYWSMANPAALDMRDANAPASTALYFLCGVIWLYNGSLSEMKRDIEKALKEQKTDA